MSINKFPVARLLVAVCMAASSVLSGCGGGGAGAAGGAGPGTTTSASQAVALDVLKSVPTVNSKGTDTVTLNVVTKNAQNAVLANQPVTLSTTDRGVRLSPAAARTDENGQATFTLQISTPDNRSIPVVAQSGTASASASVDVVGTTLSMNGPLAVVQGGTATYTVAVRDSAGNAVQGAPISVTSQRGNSISPATLATDSNGQARLTVTATSAQNDVLTVRASGASSTANLRVSPTGISVVAAGGAGEIDVDTEAAVTVTLRNNGIPVSGQSVSLTATRGTLGATMVMVANGTASTTIKSARAGFATLQATAPDGTAATAEIEFVSRTAAKISTQPSPSTVSVNLGTSVQPHTSQIIAIVRDLADNPVKGTVVNFTSGNDDPSNGSLSPPSAVTDSNGIASSVFKPGAAATGNGAIKITGAVAGTAIKSEASLTASRRELSVSFGTGNETFKIDDVFNEKPYGVIVTDSAGNPVKDVQIQATLVPTPRSSGNAAYFKGAWIYDTTEGSWSNRSQIGCLNEDSNENLQLDPNEDVNNNGRLDPRSSDATVYFENDSKVTDDKGSAKLRVRYLRDRGGWVQVRLAVTATVVAGTEGYGYIDFILPVLASDMTNSQVAPPGARSPYGVSTSCSNPN